jgi:hypothetical protein
VLLVAGLAAAAYFSVSGSAGAGMGIFVFTYIVYLIEAFTSHTRSYLSNIGGTDEVVQHITTMQRSAPIFWWSIQNYHMHHERYWDSASESYKTRTKRVNTHFARGYFRYQQWRDCSPILPPLRTYFLTKLDFKLHAHSGDDTTQHEYEEQKDRFRCRNHRDQQYDWREGIEICGMKSRMLCEAEPGARPAMMSLTWYIISSMFGFSLIFRLWMDSKTGKAEYCYDKEVYCEAYSHAPVVVQQTTVIVQAAGTSVMLPGGAMVATSPAAQVARPPAYQSGAGYY